MNDGDVSIQLGLFGRATVVEATHVVAAHIRLLPSGGTTVVSEHVRWNRGRTDGPTTPRRKASVAESAQLPLGIGGS